jgi:hypothetical protein
MAGVSSKKRKISEENRLFQDNWEEEYFVVQNKEGSTTCLNYRETVIVRLKIPCLVISWKIINSSEGRIK